MNFKKFAIFSLVGLSSAAAYPFKIDYAHIFFAVNSIPFVEIKKSIHEDITADALMGIKFVFESGVTGTVSEETIKAIQEENTENDEKGLEYGFMHFDDSRLLESAEYTWNAVNAAINLYKASTDGMGELVTNQPDDKTFDGWSTATNLGTAAHTLQDFFAHSTWVETNDHFGAFDTPGLKYTGRLEFDSEEYLSLPKIGIKKDPFSTDDFFRHAKQATFFNDDGGKTGKSSHIQGGCKSDTPHGQSSQYDASRLQLSSAYYDYQMSNMPAFPQGEIDKGWSTTEWSKGTNKSIARLNTRRLTDEPINWPEDFCVHGGDIGSGLNKDQKSRDGHAKAYTAATQATRAMFLHFLNEAGVLRDNHNIMKACGRLIKCEFDASRKFEDFMIAPPLPDKGYKTRSKKPVFKFRTRSELANEGLLKVMFEDDDCMILDDAANTTTKHFICESEHKGPGKIKIYQKANTAKPLLDFQDFVLICEKGEMIADGTCPEIVIYSENWLLDKTIRAAVSGLSSIITEVEWRFGDIFFDGQTTPVKTGTASASWDSVPAGVHRLVLWIYDHSRIAIAQFEKEFALEVPVQQITTVTANGGLAGTYTTVVIEGLNLPINQPLVIELPACSQMSYLSKSSTRHEISCQFDTEGTYAYLIKSSDGLTELGKFSIVIKAAVVDPQADLHDNFNGSSLDPNNWNIKGLTTCGDHQVTSGKATFFGGAYADTQDKKTFAGKKIVIEAIMGGTQGNRDTHFELVDVATGQTIQVGDTNDNATVAAGLYLVTNPGSGRNDFDQRGIEATTAKIQAYRLTLQGHSATLERGDSFTGAMSTHTFTLSRSIAGKTFYLRVGTGAADCVYSPGTFDSIKVTTESVQTNALSDDFNGDALDLTKWSSAGYGYEVNANTSLAGSYTIGNGVIDLGYAGGVATFGKQHFKGHKIVVEARVARTGAGEFPIALVNTQDLKDRITISDTGYCGAGFLGGVAGRFQFSKKYPFCYGESGYGFLLGKPAAVGEWMEYRLTVDGTKFTMERGPTLDNITQSATETMNLPIDPFEWFLYFRTGSAGGYYGAKFDWIRVNVTPTAP